MSSGSGGLGLGSGLSIEVEGDPRRAEPRDETYDGEEYEDDDEEENEEDHSPELLDGSGTSTPLAQRSPSLAGL